MAFASLVQTHQAGLLRTAKTIVFTQADAEEVLQETWLAVLVGIQRFEGRSSLKTWIDQILIYRARNRRNYERRYISFDQMPRPHQNGDLMSISQGNSSTAVNSQEWCRNLPRVHWDDQTPAYASPVKFSPRSNGCSNQMPPVQKRVFMLHHFEPFATTEIRELLNLSAHNQRIIRHRARLTMRQTLSTLYRSVEEFMPVITRWSSDDRQHQLEGMFKKICPARPQPF